MEAVDNDTYGIENDTTGSGATDVDNVLYRLLLVYNVFF